MSGRGLAVSFTKVELVCSLSHANVRAFHESPGPPMHFPLRLLSLKVVCFCCLLNNFEASLTNSVDADQTAPAGSVRSGSTLFVSIFMLNDNQTLFCWRFEV